MSDDLIKLPVRYVERVEQVISDDGNMVLVVASSPKRPLGEYTATAINEHTALRDRVTALTEALERAKNELRLHCGQSGCKDSMSVCMLCEIASGIDRALYRGEEEKG